MAPNINKKERRSQKFNGIEINIHPGEWKPEILS
jgi:hypothetical protein